MFGDCAPCFSPKLVKPGRSSITGALMDISAFETFLRTTVAALAVKVLAAIAFWFVGRWLIGRVIGLVQAAMHRKDIDATLPGSWALSSASR
jgi:small conductance mechanosensitive channel